MEIKEKQKLLRSYAKEMAKDMRTSASQLTHRGKQKLLAEAVSAERMKTIRGIMQRIAKEDIAGNDIRGGVKFDRDGMPQRVGFMMPRHAFLAMIGVGNAHPTTNRRKEFDFYNPVIDSRIGRLADMLTEFSADLIPNAFTTKRLFDKEL